MPDSTELLPAGPTSSVQLPGLPGVDGGSGFASLARLSEGVSTLPHSYMPSSTTNSGAKRILGVGLAALLTCSSALQAADSDRFAKVEITSQPVAGPVHMLEGAGGNIAASIGADGTLIVDDQFAPLAERIQTQLNELDGAVPRIVINTHHHGDHTGSNETFGAAATVIAHANVRERLVDAQSPRTALPVVTFDDRVRVHFNDEAIDIVHMPAGHTDGDSVVWFRGSNVIHMGDHLFAGSYPYIDVDSGGSVTGVMKNLTQVLEMVDDETRVIPGHGVLSSTEAIRQALYLVRDSALLIMRETESGTSDADLIAKLKSEFPAAGKGFIKPERWLSIVRASRARYGS